MMTVESATVLLENIRVNRKYKVLMTCCQSVVLLVCVWPASLSKQIPLLSPFSLLSYCFISTSQKVYKKEIQIDTSSLILFDHKCVFIVFLDLNIWLSVL